jgi:putative protease
VRAVVGSAVVKMGGREEFGLSEEACRKKLAAARPVPDPLILEITVTDRTLAIGGETAVARLQLSYPVETLPARATPLDEAILTRTFGKTGGHLFSLAGLTARTSSPVAIPPSRLNEIRRDF